MDASQIDHAWYGSHLAHDGAREVVRLRSSGAALSLRSSIEHWTAPGYSQRTAPAGRICSCPGCATTLSIYNKGDRCAVHQEETSSPAPQRPRRRKSRSLRRDGRPDAIQRAQRALRAAS